MQFSSTAQNYAPGLGETSPSGQRVSKTGSKDHRNSAGSIKRDHHLKSVERRMNTAEGHKASRKNISRKRGSAIVVQNLQNQNLKQKFRSTNVSPQNFAVPSRRSNYPNNP
jgi:hypothetical protein